jgi:glutamine amidotransferase
MVRQPLTDPVFCSIAAHTASTAVFAHVRAASGSTAITDANCHPFQFGRCACASESQPADADRSS